ncbi:SET domain-containing protein [Parashewanella spongiae]|uniref:SET domain-containing protein-lysine N-methyltransferase n=1 Tax=Parashewanella spongiae TaxID=342950 RepID=UPI0014768D7F|nr:SET domain-containing protein [Parashewanella spongiae]MCL1079371.1 SET domain-containing protein [Parashewanella spongiae]
MSNGSDDEQAVKKHHNSHKYETSKKASKQGKKAFLHSAKVDKNQEIARAELQLELDEKKAQREALTFGQGRLILQCNSLGVRGLYADRNFKEGCYITKFDGFHQTIDQKRLKEIKADSDLWAHMTMLDNKTVIFGYKEPVEGEGAACFANDGRISVLHPSNAVFIRFSSGSIYLKATKNIALGEEILVDYGDKEHWKLVKEHDRQTYRQIFKKQVRSRKQVMKLVGNPHKSEQLKCVLPAFDSTPVPQFPEWKTATRQWTNSLLRYTLYKRKICTGNIINLDVLRQLNPAGNDYLNAMLSYFEANDGEVESYYQYFNKAGNGLDVPDVGIFIEPKQWHFQYFHYLIWRCGKKRDLTKDKVTGILKVIDTGHPDYCKLIHQYCMMTLGPLEEEATLDASDSEMHAKLSQIFTNFQSAHVELPKILTQGTGCHKVWSLLAIIELLNHMGVDVISSAENRVQVLSNRLAKSAETGDKACYYLTLKKILIRNDYKLSHVISHYKVRNHPLAKLPYEFSGVNWCESKPTSYFLALHLTGNGISSDALKHSNMTQLANVLSLIDHKRHLKTVKEILAIMAASYSHPDSLGQAMRKRGLKPPVGVDWSRSYIETLKREAKLNLLTLIIRKPRAKPEQFK